MTTKDKVQAIAAIIDQFNEQQGGGQAALGTISAISAIVDIPEENDREAAITALDKAFGIGGEEQRSAASAAFDKMMFGDNADV